MLFSSVEPAFGSCSEELSIWRLVVYSEATQNDLEEWGQLKIIIHYYFVDEPKSFQNMSQIKNSFEKVYVM